MTTPVSLPAKRWHTLGRVLAVLGILVLTIMVAGFVALATLVRSMGAVGDLARSRNELVACLDAAPSSTVQVVVPSWLMALVRLGAPTGDLEPEVSAWLTTMHAAEVGVYGLGGPPQHHDVLFMLNRADTLVTGEGWGGGFRTRTGLRMDWAHPNR